MAEKEWLTIPEIAAATGKSSGYVRSVIKCLAAPDQQRQRLPAGRGRQAVEYHLTCLPPDMQLVVRPGAALLPAPLPHEQQRPDELKDWQKEKWTACLGVVREVHKLEADGTPRYRAIEVFCNYFNGGLFKDLLPASRTGSLSKTRVSGLCRLYDEGGELALMPAGRFMPKLRKDEWLPYFLQRIWRDRDTGKNGRSIADCYRDLEAVLPKNVPCPTYHTVRNYLLKMSSVERNKGRLTGNALKATRGYTKQKSPQWPLDCVFCDGHAFKAYAKHPETGKSTILEVCWVVDWATRMPLGFAVGLAESKWTVSAALLRSFVVTEDKRYGGIPLVLKTDGGSGNLSKLITDQWGLLARAGVQEHQVGRPGDPACQAIIEAANKVLINAAKRFWTYRGDDADADSLRKKVILINKNEAQNDREIGHRTCTLTKVPSVDEVIKAIVAELNDYAQREHGGLPEYYCAIDRKNKHYSPVQYWRHLVDTGWEQPPAVPQEVLDSFQLPREPRVCRRELVQIGNCVYHSADLAGWHGKKVLVERQLWDAQLVKVYDMEGRRICVAQLDGHVKDALALTPLEEYRVKRVERIVKLKERYIEDQRHELDSLLNPPPMRSVNPNPVPIGGLIATLQRPAKTAPAREPEPLPAPLMPILSGEEFHAQCAAAIARGEGLSVDDRELLADYYESAEGQDYLTFGGRNLLA